MIESTHPIPDFEIREATKEDITLILEFIHALAVYEKLSHEVVATESDLEKYLFSKEKVAEVIIAYYKNHPVGFALFFHNFSTFLGKPGIYLEDIFVYEKYRGMGFGKKLLTYIAKLAVKRGCGRFEWAVLDWNEPSIKFYESLGAKIMNEWLINRVTGDALERLAERY
jgi:GNAT superfamily N-acetyltransferase